MNPEIQLPCRVSPDEPTLRLWSGDISEIPELLRERTDRVARNFLTITSRRTDLGKHPRITRTLNNYRSEGELLINREAANQGAFTQAIKTKYDKELATAENSSGWDSSRRVKKLNVNWAGSGLEGMPA